MLLATAILLLGLSPNADPDPDLELASALARRGWVELAEELCARIEKNPAASPASRAGLPMVLAEVAVAKARMELDVLKATKELETAIERFNRPKQAPTLDERGMIGWLHVQRARILSAAAQDDAARRPGAINAWERTAAYYRASLAELEKMPPGQAVEEAMLDAHLEIPKALGAQARVPSIEPALRGKLLEESVRLLSEFQWSMLQPIQLEALLEEGRSRADLDDLVRAERCFREVASKRTALRKAGYPASEYQTSIFHESLLLLAKTLTRAKKFKDAVGTCDAFLRENPRQARSAIGWALMLAKAEALHAGGDVEAAILVAEAVSRENSGGPAGRTADERILDWTKDRPVSPERVLKSADDLMERGKYRDALVELRRLAEARQSETDRQKYEPAASFRRGECFRLLRQDAEAAVAYQEIFRKYPKHELAPRAAFEAVRALMRNSTGDPREEEQMEKLLDEVERYGFEGDISDFLKYIRGERLERKGQLKAAADLFRQIREVSELFPEALLAAGHDYRRDVDQRWEKARSVPGAREDLAKELGQAESMLRKALPRLESGGRDRAKNLATAYYELALISLHEATGKPAEALALLKSCAALLPPESEMHPRLAELEIQVDLATKNLDAAASVLNRMVTAHPDSVSTSRSCRRLAQRFEAGDPSRAAKYYSAWLDRSATVPYTPGELQQVADGLYRTARAVNRFDDAVRSVMDLKGKAPVDRAPWRAAAEAHEMLLQVKDLPEKDATVAAVHLACCAGFMANLPADWTKAKDSCENILTAQGLIPKNGALNLKVLGAKKWLLGIYLEYGHAFYQLGKAGQKFQFANALRVFGDVVDVAEAESEPWWIGKYMGILCVFERGEGSDITSAAAALSLLEGNRPGFDGGRFGMKERFVELRGQVRAAAGPQR
jgi:tetratricopeptide (TPR) repeat protein